MLFMGSRDRTDKFATYNVNIHKMLKLKGDSMVIAFSCQILELETDALGE